MPERGRGRERRCAQVGNAEGLEEGALGQDVDGPLRGVAAVAAVDGGGGHVGQEPLSAEEAVPGDESDGAGEDLPRLRE